MCPTTRVDSACVGFFSAVVWSNRGGEFAALCRPHNQKICFCAFEPLDAEYCSFGVRPLALIGPCDCSQSSRSPWHSKLGARAESKHPTFDRANFDDDVNRNFPRDRKSQVLFVQVAFALSRERVRCLRAEKRKCGGLKTRQILWRRSAAASLASCCRAAAAVAAQIARQHEPPLTLARALAF